MSAGIPMPGVRHHEKSRDSVMKGMAMSCKKVLIAMTAVMCGTAGIAVAGLIAGAAVTLSSRQASALPAYAQQTGLPCGQCHVNPAGGGPNTDFGKAFAANGHKVPKKN
jgi:hypothetical protein